MKKYLIALLCVLTIFTVGCTKKDNKQKTNKNTKEDVVKNVALEKQVINDLTFDHFAITEDSNNISVLFFDITNETTSSIYVGEVTYTLYSNGFDVLTLTEKINRKIEPNETIDVSKNIDVNLSKVDEVKYTVK